MQNCNDSNKQDELQKQFYKFHTLLLRQISLHTFVQYNCLFTHDLKKMTWERNTFEKKGRNK